MLLLENKLVGDGTSNKQSRDNDTKEAIVSKSVSVRRDSRAFILCV